MAWKRGRSSLKPLLLPRCPDAGQRVLSPGVIQPLQRASSPSAGASPAAGWSLSRGGLSTSLLAPVLRQLLLSLWKPAAPSRMRRLQRRVCAWWTILEVLPDPSEPVTL